MTIIYVIGAGGVKIFSFFGILSAAGSWDLRGNKGRLASEGTYLVLSVDFSLKIIYLIV